MSKSTLEVIREVEQDLNNIDWSIEAGMENSYAAVVGRSQAKLAILRIELEVEQECKQKIQALKAIQERI